MDFGFQFRSTVYVTSSHMVECCMWLSQMLPFGYSVPFGFVQDMMRNPFGMFDNIMANMRNRMQDMHQNMVS